MNSKISIIAFVFFGIVAAGLASDAPSSDWAKMEKDFRASIKSDAGYIAKFGELKISISDREFSSNWIISDKELYSMMQDNDPDKSAIGEFGEVAVKGITFLEIKFCKENNIKISGNSIGASLTVKTRGLVKDFKYIRIKDAIYDEFSDSIKVSE
jgi:hypothetical protein